MPHSHLEPTGIPGIPKSAPYAMHIDVLPQYMADQSDPDGDRFVFAYHVRITNIGQIAAQIISRYWVIKNAEGHVEEVNGLGLVGRQPFLQPGQGFEYTSACPLNTASGSMRGSFFCVAEDGERFDVPVLPFELFIPKE
jgi:ApaG protein